MSFLRAVVEVALVVVEVEELEGVEVLSGVIGDGQTLPVPHHHRLHQVLMGLTLIDQLELFDRINVHLVVAVDEEVLAELSTLARNDFLSRKFVLIAELKLHLPHVLHFGIVDGEEGRAFEVDQDVIFGDFQPIYVLKLPCPVGPSLHTELVSHHLLKELCNKGS
eukprot:CAMPEP_0170548256 /NCGR_PEP_ID=MMETSP0211-20121228/6588_1 /TAXON_ID=311385 /ORGANISM="Pseudokeronopsis sp., Strain OXSARD2" /LENGTH=164 /DNA_ID=CAMNT_0010853715 /DNA_START=584 /DNA_END=1075 /DNA_ORIENTATION=-